MISNSFSSLSVATERVSGMSAAMGASQLLNQFSQPRGPKTKLGRPIAPATTARIASIHNGSVMVDGLSCKCLSRSEERRVGKECRAWGALWRVKKRDEGR